VWAGALVAPKDTDEAATAAAFSRATRIQVVGPGSSGSPGFDQRISLGDSISEVSGQIGQVELKRYQEMVECAYTAVRQHEEVLTKWEHQRPLTVTVQCQPLSPGTPFFSPSTMVASSQGQTRCQSAQAAQRTLSPRPQHLAWMPHTTPLQQVSTQARPLEPLQRLHQVVAQTPQLMTNTTGFAVPGPQLTPPMQLVPRALLLSSGASTPGQISHHSWRPPGATGPALAPLVAALSPGVPLTVTCVQPGPLLQAATTPRNGSPPRSPGTVQRLVLTATAPAATYSIPVPLQKEWTQGSSAIVKVAARSLSPPASRSSSRSHSIPRWCARGLAPQPCGLSGSACGVLTGARGAITPRAPGTITPHAGTRFPTSAPDIQASLRTWRFPDQPIGQAPMTNGFSSEPQSVFSTAAHQSDAQLHQGCQRVQVGAGIYSPIRVVPPPAPNMVFPFAECSL